MRLKNIKLYEYLDISESEACGVVRGDDALVLVSDDFSGDGFLNVVVSAPLGKVWTFFPFIGFGDFFDKIAGSRDFDKKENECLSYLKRNGVNVGEIKRDLFGLFDFSSEKYLGASGEYWSIVVPVCAANDFLSWLEDSISVFVYFCGDVVMGESQDWRKGYFSEFGYWVPMWCMFKNPKDREFYRKNYGDAKYPTSRVGAEMDGLTRCLDEVRGVFYSIGVERFLVRNHFRQSQVAFPYCDDFFEEANDSPLSLIEKRVELISEFDIPHFYGSIEFGAWAGLLSAREQLVYMISKNRGRYLVGRLKDALGTLDAYLERMRKNYGSSLSFCIGSELPPRNLTPFR